MKYIIENYEPIEMFRFFEDISAIPRGSGNEKAVADYIESFAKKEGLWYRRDELNNIFIKKNATEGYEDKEPIMLQGHMDMVCEKNSDTEHDFLNDPLKLYVENGVLKAKGTTLGGDDGVAVAMMLHLLSANDVAHPDIECLFTVDEETGMSGAIGFDGSDVKATKLINLDSEAEGEATAGCAGGARVKLRYVFERIAPQNKCIKINISGLAGGHSGAEIHLPRANAIVLMGRILDRIYERTPFNLVSFRGGNKDNVIPRECEAVIASYDIESSLEIIKECEREIKAEIGRDDRKFKLRVGRPKICTEDMLTLKDSSALISLLNLSPNGVFTYSPHMQGFVESSDNIGIFELGADNAVLTALCRSSTESLLDTLINKFKRLAKLIGAEISIHDRYPGWYYEPNSDLQNAFISAAKKVYGDSIEIKVSTIHAGLECGVLKEKISHKVDAISIGPNLHNIHTPEEALELKSFENTWRVLKILLES